MAKLSKLWYDNALMNGKIVAPLYYAFAKYITRKAKYPIKVGYRQGYPIKHALDYLGVESDKLYMNRDCIQYNLDKEIIQQYAAQQGLGKPYTIVDNGYSGNNEQCLRNSPFNKLQSLLLMRLRGAYPGDAFINEIDGAPNPGFLFSIIEWLPNEHQRYAPQSFVRDDNGLLSVNLYRTSETEHEQFDAFCKGLTEGYDFADYNSKQFTAYLNILERAHHSKEATIVARPNESDEEICRRNEQMFETVEDMRSL